jgi:hypothetical protein
MNPGTRADLPYLPMPRNARNGLDGANATAARSLAPSFQIFPYQPKENPVDPLAVPLVGIALHALADEARALGVADRALVNP